MQLCKVDMSVRYETQRNRDLWTWKLTRCNKLISRLIAAAYPEYVNPCRCTSRANEDKHGAHLYKRFLTCELYNSRRSTFESYLQIQLNRRINASCDKNR